MNPHMSQRRVTPEIVLRAYAEGIFPMAETRGSTTLYWVSPDRRGILPLDGFHVPRRLARTVKAERFEVRVDSAFAEVIAACAQPAGGRDESWINDEVMGLFVKLHAMGHAHSVEAWRDGSLAGGLYGLAIGGAFFGESMFSRCRDASKVALVHLAGRLIAGGFTLLDAQFITRHLRQFGAVEIDRSYYLELLRRAIAKPADFYGAGRSAASGASVLQLITQTS